MSKIPIDEAPAGPAMDAAVAGALGYEVEWSPQPDGQKVPIYLDGEVNSRSGGRWIGWRPNWRIVPEYSTDIAKAWELVEQIHQCINKAEDGDPDILPFDLGWYQRLRLNFGQRSGWWASFDARNIKGIEPSFLCIAETAPLAICRAFLKANGVEYVEDAG